MKYTGGDSVYTLVDVKQNLTIMYWELAKNGEDNINQYLTESLAWLKDNYNEMDSEAQTYVDKVFDGILDIAGENIGKLPESYEKRKASKLYKIATGKHHSIEQLLQQLESNSSQKEDIAIEMEGYAISGIQDIMDFLLEIRENTKDMSLIPCVSLLHSCIDEFLVSIYLARHNYFIQANAHLRTIYETKDRVKLFCREPKFLEIWSGNDYKLKNKELSPSAVRKKLGDVDYDEFYEFLSDIGTHPSYKSFQSRTVILKSDDSKKHIKIMVGGQPFEHLRIFFYSSLLRIINDVLFTIFEFGKEVIKEEDVNMVLNKQESTMKLFTSKHYIRWVEENGMDASELKSHISRKW